LILYENLSFNSSFYTDNPWILYLPYLFFVHWIFFPIFKFASFNVIFFVWISGTLILMQVFLINDAWQNLTVSDNGRIWRSSSSKPGFWHSRCWVPIRGNSFLIKWWCYDYMHVFNDITCIGGLKGACVALKGMFDKKAMSYLTKTYITKVVYASLHTYAISFPNVRASIIYLHI